MRVAFDHQVFCFQRYGGISRYIVELAAHLIEHDLSEVFCVASLHRNVLLQEARSRVGVRGHFLDAEGVPIGPLLRLGNGMLQKYAWRGINADIVHETYYSQRPIGYGKRRVVTVHDMIHEQFPKQFRDYKRTTIAKTAAVLRADRVICVSEATRHKLLEHLPQVEHKTDVIHHGVSALAAHPVAEPTPKHDVAPYFLYVGDRRGYKNFSRLLDAFSQRALRATGVRLLAFGGGPFRPDELRRMQSLDIDRHVQHLSGTDILLADLYRHAVGLVLPSLAEGFGMPILEAMTLGCPVVCSRASALEEVAGDAAEYFEPTDVDSITLCLERVLHDRHRRAELLASGRKRALGYSWSKCAKQTVAVYKAAI